MDQNEFSVDGFSFDLNSDEFSLDSILNEYKDYDLDAAEDVPRPRAAFAAHPAEATLIDPEEPSPDETPPEPEAEAPSEPPSPDEDAGEDDDVREYAPARERGKKPRSGLRGWVSRVTASGEEDEPAGEEAEDVPIPVSAPPEIPEGLYTEEPRPADGAEEPTMVFHAVSDEDTAVSETKDGDTYAASGAADTDRTYEPAPAHRSFQEAVIDPIVSRIAAVSYRIRERRTEVRASAAAEEDPGPEPDADTASKYYGSHIRALRTRLRLSAVVCAILLYVSLGLPVLGLLRTDPTVLALLCLVLLLTVMLIGLDVITLGIMALARRRPGLESMVFLSCCFSILDAVVCAIRGTAEAGLPFCGVSALAVVCCIWSALLTCRAYRLTFHVLSKSDHPHTISSDSNVTKDGITILKSKRSTSGFIHRSEESGPTEAVYSAIAPYLIAVALILGVLAAILSGSYVDLAHILAAVFAACVPLAAIVAFALPYRTAARRLHPYGLAIAGWSGASDIGRSKHLIVTDRDVFPPQTISIESIRILEGSYPEKVISYAASVVIASGSCLAPVFSEQLRKYNCALVGVETFNCSENGGLTAFINGEQVLVGSSDFIHLRGIRLPQKLLSKESVFVAINGVLVGIFSIRYVPVKSVQNALLLLLHSRLEPIFAVRDANVTPLMLREKFQMSTDGFDFPAFSRRYSMSAAEPGPETQIAGIVSRDGLGPLVTIASLGKRLYAAVRAGVVLAMLGVVIGVVMMFLLCAMGSFDSATAGNLLLFQLAWLIPIILLNLGLRR